LHDRRKPIRPSEYPMKLRHFSIRDLLWLFVVVALATGWGLDRVKLEHARRNELVERQKAMVASRVLAAELAFQQAQTAAANESLLKAYKAMGYEEANPASKP
jgi:hypothetical protein